MRALHTGGCEHILIYMKQILIELDDKCAKDLELVAPAKKRMRAEFIRLAIQRALDLALDRKTRRSYAETPLAAVAMGEDLTGWDMSNGLAKGAEPSTRRRSKSAA